MPGYKYVHINREQLRKEHISGWPRRRKKSYLIRADIIFPAISYGREWKFDSHQMAFILRTSFHRNFERDENPITCNYLRAHVFYKIFEWILLIWFARALLRRTFVYIHWLAYTLDRNAERNMIPYCGDSYTGAFLKKLGGAALKRKRYRLNPTRPPMVNPLALSCDIDEIADTILCSADTFLYEYFAAFLKNEWPKSLRILWIKEFFVYSKRIDRHLLSIDTVFFYYIKCLT